MDLLVTTASYLSIGLGVVALLIGSLGLVRLPDVYARIHAVGMIDTAGASLIILGMVIHAGFTLVSAKLILIGVFMFFTSPIATHALARAAHKMGVVPVGRNLDKPARKTAKKAAKTPGKLAVQRKAKTKSAAAKRRPS